jgi:hypothetical protein
VHGEEEASCPFNPHFGDDTSWKLWRWPIERSQEIPVLDERATAIAFPARDTLF